MKQIFQRYALALFWLAQEENQISEFMNECQQILKIFAKNQDFLQLIKNDALKKEEKKEILSSVFKNEIPSKILYFMNVIVDHHREKYIQEIIEEFILILSYHNLVTEEHVVCSNYKSKIGHYQYLSRNIEQVYSNKSNK